MEDKGKVKFWTLTGSDFKRAIDRSKTETNSVREQIKQKLKEMNTQPPPEDLAGYQHIPSGLIKEGDIIVDKIDRLKRWAKYPNDAFFSLIEGLKYHDVYRKIPVPKQGDLDHAPMHYEGVPVSAYEVSEPIPERFQGLASTDDKGKDPLSRLPWAAIRQVSKVQAFGHLKHKEFDNYRKGMEITRNISCALRHIADYMEGKTLDDESGLNNLAHAACRLLFVLQNISDKTAIDDRYFKPKP